MLAKKPKTKAGWIATIVFTAVILAGSAWLVIYASREPEAVIGDDAIIIRGMYGTTVDLSDITNVTLLEQSMRDIGAGSRRNGSSGSTWRGYFDAGLLFVRPDASPTLRIDRTENRPIFISLADGVKTRQLFRDIQAAR
ncbi:MAG: hypothetical protein FWE90_07835 [Defluviitaleaceae bacterium]|nr:hypothetical protein [Defluviitaleaceae bacterium]